MIVRKFKPLWSYDIYETEQWLTKMHQTGYALKNVSFPTRMFYFEKTEPGSFQYHLLAHNTQDTGCLPRGYTLVCTSSHYTILKSNDNPGDSILRSKENFYRRNIRHKNIMLTFLLLSAILSGLCLLFLFALIAPFSFFFGFSFLFAVEKSLTLLPFFYIPLTCLIPILIWSAIAYKKLSQSNQRYRKDRASASTVSPLYVHWEKYVEKYEKGENEKIQRQIRFPWLGGAPDRLEAWLEKKASKGYRLVRISSNGWLFHFIQGSPQQIKYQMDCQIYPSIDYYSLNRDAGWRLRYVSHSTETAFVFLWEQPYIQKAPQFFSDTSSKFILARRIIRNLSIPAFLFCGLFSWQIISLISDLLEGFFVCTYCVLLALCLLIFIIELFLAFRPIFYYFRLRRTNL